VLRYLQSCWVLPGYFVYTRLHLSWPSEAGGWPVYVRGHKLRPLVSCLEHLLLVKIQVVPRAWRAVRLPGHW
jgi:hypothetical protein